MVSSFDLTKLQLLLNDFYTLTHIRITVFDEQFQELTSCPTQLPAFCRLIRRQAWNDAASATGKPATFPCTAETLISINVTPD